MISGISCTSSLVSVVCFRDREILCSEGSVEETNASITNRDELTDTKYHSTYQGCQVQHLKEDWRLQRVKRCKYNNQ